MSRIKQKELASDEKVKQHTREKIGKTQIQQQRWFTIISLASRLVRMRAFIEQNHQNHLVYINTTHAAKIIQRVYRAHVHRLQQERVKRALSLISIAFKPFIKLRREKMKNLAADKIRQFFIDVHDVSKLIKVVKKV